jgi:Ca2+-binding RTX toxin-like protein
MVLLFGGTLLVGVMLFSGVALADNIIGTFGDDPDLDGTAQRDRIYGLGGQDTITGFGGNDQCYGGSGADTISCSGGNDRIDGGFGEDELSGNTGNDTILAADGQADQVDCGNGEDTAYVDELDDPVENCENVFVAAREVTV